MTAVEPQAITYPEFAWMPPVYGPPPAFKPWPNTVYDVAEVRDSTGRDPVESTWPVACEQDYVLYEHDCATPGLDKTAALLGAEWSVSLRPHTIIAGDRCAPVGRTEAEASERARDMLGYVEPIAVGQIVEAWLSSETSGPAAMAAPTTYVEALGQLECAARANASMGSIMLPPLSASQLSDRLVRQGDRLFTVLGTPVWLGRCLPAGGEVGYAMGPIVVERGSVEVLVGFNRQRNDRVVIAERTVVVTVGCTPTKVTIPLT